MVYSSRLASEHTITGTVELLALALGAPFTGKKPDVSMEPEAMSAVVVSVDRITLVIICVVPGRMLVKVVVPTDTATTVTVDGGAVTVCVTVDWEGKITPEGPRVIVMGPPGKGRKGFCGGGEDVCGWPRNSFDPSVQGPEGAGFCIVTGIGVMEKNPWLFTWDVSYRVRLYWPAGRHLGIGQLRCFTVLPLSCVRRPVPSDTVRFMLVWDETR